MGVGSRPATCTSCGKRLSRKSWYYRNGKYFCKKRCWATENEKAATEAQKQKEAALAQAQPEAPAPTKGGTSEAAPSAAPTKS